MATCVGCGKKNGMMIPEFTCEECKEKSGIPDAPDTYVTIKGVLIPNPEYENWCKKYKSLRYKW